MDNRGKGCRHAEEGVLQGLSGLLECIGRPNIIWLQWSLRPKHRVERSSCHGTRLWVGPEEILANQLGREKWHLSHKVYCGNWELLTLTRDIVRWWKKCFEDIFNCAAKNLGISPLTTHNIIKLREGAIYTSTYFTLEEVTSKYKLAWGKTCYLLVQKSF